MQGFLPFSCVLIPIGVILCASLNWKILRNSAARKVGLHEKGNVPILWSLPCLQGFCSPPASSSSRVGQDSNILVLFWQNMKVQLMARIRSVGQLNRNSPLIAIWGIMERKKMKSQGKSHSCYLRTKEQKLAAIFVPLTGNYRRDCIPGYLFSFLVIISFI